MKMYAHFFFTETMPKGVAQEVSKGPWGFFSTQIIYEWWITPVRHT
jgi:hypothetical protein